MDGLYLVFLFVLWLRIAAGYVEPPTNVILHCRNLHNTLEWSHSQLSTPGLRFRADIRSVSSSLREIWVNSTTARRMDLSSFSDPSNDYFLTVTAVIGQNESDPAPGEGLTFSYFQDSLAEQKCFLDFPPVNITAQPDGTILFRFTHPMLVYPKLAKKKSPDLWMHKKLPEFKYKALITNQTEYPHSFSCEQRVCEKKLSVDEAQKEHCLRVEGELQKITVKGTQEYCAQPFQRSLLEEKGYTFVYVICGIFATAVVAMFLFMVYRRKTKSSGSSPRAVTFGERVKQLTMQVTQEQFFVPVVEPSTPTQSLMEEKESTPTVTPPEEKDIRLRIGTSMDDEGQSDGVRAGDAEEFPYRQGRYLDEDEEQHSGYEKRQVLVEVGPGDVVEGYRG